MPISEHTVSIKSDHGSEHVYTITQHPAEEGFDVLLPKVLRVISKGTGPLLNVVGDAMQTSGEVDLGAIEVDGQVGDKVGAAIYNLATELVAVGGSSFCKEVLKYSVRANEEGGLQKVAPAFGTIYQGNYGELVRAIAAVIKVNFGPSLRAIPGLEHIKQMMSSRIVPGA